MGKKKIFIIIAFSMLSLPVLHTLEADEGPRTEAGRIALNIKEQTAIAASIAGTTVTRALKNFSIEAIPENSDSNGCVPVRVVSETPRWKEVNQYRVCNGLISDDESLPAELLLNQKERDFDLFLQEIAGKAEKYGMAQGLFQSFTIKAVALRQQNNCSVEVNIFKDKDSIEKLLLPCE